MDYMNSLRKGISIVTKGVLDTLSHVPSSGVHKYSSAGIREEFKMPDRASACEINRFIPIHFLFDRLIPVSYPSVS